MELTKEKTEASNEQAFSYIEAYEKNIDSNINQIKSYVYQEPAIVLTTLYLTISTIGISYIAFVLLSFGINVLPHVELSDFILSAIHHPQTLLVFIAFFIFAVLLFKFEALFRKKWQWYRKQLNKHHQKNTYKHPALLFALVIFVYLFVSATVQSIDTKKALIAGEQQIFTLHLSSPIFLEGEPNEKLENVQVIANLSKHLWVYQHSSEQVFMVPQENQLLLTPIKEKQLSNDAKKQEIKND